MQFYSVLSLCIKIERDDMDKIRNFWVDGENTGLAQTRSRIGVKSNTNGKHLSLRLRAWWVPLLSGIQHTSSKCSRYSIVNTFRWFNKKGPRLQQLILPPSLLFLLNMNTPPGSCYWKACINNYPKRNYDITWVVNYEYNENIWIECNNSEM